MKRSWRHPVGTSTQQQQQDDGWEELVQQVLAGDTGPCIVSHLPLQEVLAVAHTSRGLRAMVLRLVLPRLQHVSVRALSPLENLGPDPDPDPDPCTLNAPYADLPALLSRLRLRSLRSFQARCTPRFFGGLSTPNDAAPLRSLTSLVLHLHLGLPAKKKTCRCSPERGVSYFPGLPLVFNAAARSLGRLSLQGCDFVLGPTWLGCLPALPSLSVLELNGVHTLPSLSVLTAVFARMPRLRGLEIERANTTTRANDHVFGTTLVDALHAAGAGLHELAVFGAWLNLGKLTSQMPCLVNLTWHPPDCDDAAVDTDWAELMAPPTPCDLLTLRVFAHHCLVFQRTSCLEHLGRACPRLWHLHLEDTPLVLPEHRRRFGNATLARMWSAQSLLQALTALPSLTELELGLEWPEELEQGDETELVDELVDEFVSLLSRSQITSVEVSLQSSCAPPPRSTQRAAGRLEKGVIDTFGHARAQDAVEFRCCAG